MKTLDPMEKAALYPTDDMLSNETCYFGEPHIQPLKCPVCSFNYVHEEYPYVIKGFDDYKAGWEGRGNLTVLPFWSECGSRFELCIGFHKGQSFTFLRLLKSCVHNEEEEVEEEVEEEEEEFNDYYDGNDYERSVTRTSRYFKIPGGRVWHLTYARKEEEDMTGPLPPQQRFCRYRNPSPTAKEKYVLSPFTLKYREAECGRRATSGTIWAAIEQSVSPVCHSCAYGVGIHGHYD